MTAVATRMSGTFFFTDIEGSTGRWDRQPEQMAADLAVHDDLLREVIETNGGDVFKHMGDGFCAVFPTPQDGVRAAAESQRRLAATDWQVEGGIRVRMGLHHGEALSVGGDYFGPSLNRSARIMAAGHGGQILVSDIVARQVDGHVEGIDVTDLGEQRLRGLSDHERLHQVDLAGTSGTFPPLRVLTSYQHNLPHQLSTIVGRGTDVEQLTDHLKQSRLVTLTGVGGCGKSRLALEAAVEVLPRFAQGVWLAEMAPLTSDEFVAMKLAVNLGHGERLAGVDDGDQDAILAGLCKAIGADDLLIVIDNCEHLLRPIAQAVRTLLEGCPNVRVLATSREALAVPGEQVFTVPPLPAPVDADTVAAVVSSASGELFLDRARSISPDFQLTDENAPAIASICRRLDGLPLAVELAAARVQMLGPEQIDQRLADSLRLLRGRSATATERHQTLLATMEWSHDLLDEDERALFRGLAVFRGGFTLEAAERVCGFGPIDELDVMDLLEGLVSRSLVSFRPGERPRYVLLEVVRQFAERKLQESDDVDELVARHFDWVLELVEEARPVEVAQGTERLLPERHNIRAAFERAVDRGVDGDRLLQLAYAMWRYLLESGQIPEGLSKLREALDAPHTTGTLLEARAIDALGSLADARGDVDLARDASARAVALCEALGDEHALAWSRLRQGMVSGDLAVEREDHPFRLAQAWFESEGHGGSLAWTLVEIATAWLARDEVERSREAFEQAATISWGDDRNVRALALLGETAARMLAGAAELGEELDQRAHDLVDMQMHFTGVRGLLLAACASIGTGRHDAAAGHASRALEYAQESGATTQAQYALEWGAQALAGLGDAVPAAMLWGRTLAVRERKGVVVPPMVERVQSGMVGQLADLLGERAQQVMDEGAGMSLADAVRLARSRLPVVL